MKPLTAGLMLALAAVPAAAQQGLADPTRPPAFVPASAADAPAPPGPQLQSVLLSSGRKLAVIDGVTVALGGRFGAATLVRITETEVVLRGDAGLTRLTLYPGVEKKSARRSDVRSAAPAAATGETKR